MNLPESVTEVARGVFCVRDSCNVYLIVADAPDAPAGRRTAVAVDFGSGLALDHLDALGIDSITDIVMTHHHRDQAQGLPRAIERGIRIHVPPVELDLFTNVEEMWQGRQLENDYNLRQDRFSILQNIRVDSTVLEYRAETFGGVSLRTEPTPGHTPGSVTYLLDRDDEIIAFTGDLIYAPGKVWSLAASQWSYTHHEGPAMTVLSSYLLQAKEPTLLLPSHGKPMPDAIDALHELAVNMQSYVDSRRWHPWDLKTRIRQPWVRLTDHLLLNRSSMSCTYALLSEGGEALLVDFGYDITTGLPTGNDRASRRPWLASVPALKDDFGVTRISVALPTHYHDDHVAGMPLLRAVEGTEIWSPANVAPILDDPMQHDLPCLWFDPINSDRVLPLGESFRWNEYEITVHEQPGHTLYAVAYEVKVDGVTVLFTGDQQENLGVPGERRELLNYQYRNRFRIDDYIESAALYKRVAPGLLASGHWEPRWVEEGYLDYLAEEGQFVHDIHHTLLPLDEFDLAADSILARITPYRSRVEAGSTIDFAVTVRNPHPLEAEARVRPIAPLGWRVSAPELTRMLAVGEEASIPFSITAGDSASRRSRVAVDIAIGDLYLGQHAEALVDVE